MPVNNDPDVIDRTKPDEKTKPKRPSMYKVLIFNDDYTPMEFVIYVLQKYFHMDEQKATTIMLAVHRKGVGVAGVFTLDVAETKVQLVMDDARKHGHPLMLSTEKDDS